MYQQWEKTNVNHGITLGSYSSRRITNLCIVSVRHVMIEGYVYLHVVYNIKWHYTTLYGVIQGTFCPMQLYGTIFKAHLP